MIYQPFALIGILCFVIVFYIVMRPQWQHLSPHTWKYYNWFGEEADLVIKGILKYGVLEYKAYHKGRFIGEFTELDGAKKCLMHII